jgi:hypothetical protein
MKTILKAIVLTALLCAASAHASVFYTNETDTAQTVTIQQDEQYSYYGNDNSGSTGTFTQVVEPGETVSYDDYITTWGDGGSYRLTFDLIAVE